MSPVLLRSMSPYPLAELCAERVSLAHWDAMGQAGWPQQAEEGCVLDLLHWVRENHRCNALLWWHQEQRLRPRGLEAGAALEEEVEHCRRLRSAAIDAIDETLAEAASGTEPRPGAQPPRESVGTQIDRLSTNALEIFHFGLQLQGEDSCEAQLGRCDDKLAQLRMQRAGLMQELDDVLRRLAQGELSYPSSRPIESYQEPALESSPPPRAS